MNSVDAYVFARIFKPMGIALVIAVLVLLLERILRLLDLILGAEGSLSVFFEIIAYLVPEYAGLALPMSLMLGLMLGFNQLSRDGEIDAFQSSGFGLMRQARPALVLALLIMLVTAVILGYVKPFARYAYQSVLYAVTEAAFHVLLRPNVFAEFGGTTVLVEGVRPETGTFSDVFLYEPRADGGSTVITARDGTVTRAAEGGMPIMRLFDGVRLAIGPAERMRAEASTATVGVLRFAELRTLMSDDGAGLFRGRGGDRREYTLDELWSLRHRPPDGVRASAIVSELHSRIVQTLSVAVLPLLAISLALGRRRSDRIYGIAVGLLVLIGYNQLLDFGKNLVQNGTAGPLLALWSPFAVLTAVSALAFYRVAERVPRAREFNAFGWLRDRLQARTESAGKRAHIG